MQKQIVRGDRCPAQRPAAPPTRGHCPYRFCTLGLLSPSRTTQDPSTQHSERRDPLSPRAARRPPSLGWTPRGSPGDLQGPDAQARYRGGGSLQQLLRTQRRLGEQPGTRVRRHRKLPAALGSVSGRRDLLTARHCSLDTARPLRSAAPPETSRRVKCGFRTFSPYRGDRLSTEEGRRPLPPSSAEPTGQPEAPRGLRTGSGEMTAKVTDALCFFRYFVPSFVFPVFFLPHFSCTLYSEVFMPSL